MLSNCVIFSKNDQYPTQVVSDICTKNGIKNIVCIHVFPESPDFLAGLPVQFITFSDYQKPEYMEIQHDPDTLMLVVKDLCHMVANRLDKRLEMIYTRQRAKCKVVIDEAPYQVHPWKYFFPVGVFDRTRLGYPHSYAIEGEWKKYQDDLRDSDPCSPELFHKATHDITFIDYDKYFELEPKFHVVEVSDQVHQNYQSLKKQLFETETSPARIIKKLHDYSKAVTPFHTLPVDLKKIYNSSLDFTMSNLKVDLYLKSEIERIVTHTNELTRLLHVSCLSR